MHPTKGIGIGLAFVGMVAFGVYHWFFVAPVAAVFIEGVLWALGAGAALGWAYERTMLDHGRTGPWWGMVFGLALAATLVPYEIAGILWGPFPTETPGEILTVVPFAFLGVPFALLFGWLLENRQKVSWPFLVLVLSIHFMIGGSVTTFGGRGTTFVLFMGFVVAEITAGLILGWWSSTMPRDSVNPVSPVTGSIPRRP